MLLVGALPGLLTRGIMGTWDRHSRYKNQQASHIFTGQICLGRTLTTRMDISFRQTMIFQIQAQHSILRNGVAWILFTALMVHNYSTGSTEGHGSIFNPQ